MTSGLLNSAAPELAPSEPEEDLEDDNEDEQAALMGKDIDGVDETGPGDMSQTKFIVVTTLIIVVSFLIAAEVDELEVGKWNRPLGYPRRKTPVALTSWTVLGFVGSTGSTILSFILPGFFHFILFRQEKSRTKWFALLLGIYGIAVMCFW